MTDTQLTMIIGFAGTIAAQAFQYWRTEQKIKERALELKEAANEAAIKVASVSREEAGRMHEKLEVLRDLQVENTRVTEAAGTKADAAFKEANDLDLKILEVKHGTEAKLERIDSITTDTNDTVQALKQNGKT